MTDYQFGLFVDKLVSIGFVFLATVMLFSYLHAIWARLRNIDEKLGKLIVLRSVKSGALIYDEPGALPFEPGREDQQRVR